METLQLQLQGMRCAGCANAIEKAIRAVPGVIECSINFGTEQATVKYNSTTNAKQIQQAVVKAGYAATPLVEMKTRRRRGNQSSKSATARFAAQTHRRYCHQRVIITRLDTCNDGVRNTVNSSMVA